MPVRSSSGGMSSVMPDLLRQEQMGPDGCGLSLVSLASASLELLGLSCAGLDLLGLDLVGLEISDLDFVACGAVGSVLVIVLALLTCVAV